jgi:hypothetical protein
MGEMAKVLVLQRRPDGGHVGFWAEFEGEKVSSYEDTRGENNIVYTLYRCTAYQGDAYRVHIANESDPGEPDYMLHPVRWDPRPGSGRPDFSEVWNREDIAEKFPLFLKDMEDYLETLPADPS